MVNRIYPFKPASAEDKSMLASFLLHRLGGIEKALSTVSSALPAGAERWSDKQYAYYSNVRAYLIQLIKQLGFSYVETADTRAADTGSGEHSATGRNAVPGD